LYPAIARIFAKDPYVARVVFEMFNRHLWPVWDLIVRADADRMALSLRVKAPGDDEQSSTYKVAAASR
jgi:hypothetical protein